MSPLVSIIMPAFNREALIADAIQSVLSQDLADWELIIVDDGSNDRTCDVVSGFKDQRIHLLRSPHLGAAGARNVGLERASGQYILFLDSDDQLSRGKLRSQVELLKQSPKNFVATCSWRELEAPGVLGKTLLAPELARDFKDPKEFVRAFLSVKNSYQTACWLTPRSVIERVGPWLSLGGSSHYDDWEFFSRVALTSSGLVFDPTGEVYYRNADTGLGGTISVEIASATLRNFESMEKYFRIHFAESEADRLAGLVFLIFFASYKNRYPALGAQSLEHLLRCCPNPESLLPGPRGRLIAKWFGLKTAVQLSEVYLALKRRIK